ncbi:MAG: hypothetical protein E7508_10990 [Ruminococcus sp.]|nr:hypothetical protein [Ruminococcus sp.]
MSFQDELRQNLRTPEVVKREEEERKQKSATIEAECTLIRLKLKLTENVKNAQYTIHDGVATVSSLEEISSLYLRERKQIDSVNIEIWHHYDLNPTYKEDFELFISKLKQLALNDNISIECVLADCSCNKTHFFPAKIPRPYTYCKLCVRATTDVALDL